MVQRSQNGWSANDRSKIKTYTVPGTTTQLAVRKGDVATVLLYVAEQFDKHVEDIDTPASKGYVHDLLAVSGSEPSRVRDDWAFAFRNIRGSSTTLSNHSSGTAIDLNATQHPRGVGGTFTAAQKRAVRSVMSFCGGVVRWGEDYRNAPIDGMHFEINAGSVKVALLAAKIKRVRKAEAKAAADVKHRAAVAKAAKTKLARDAAAAAVATKKRQAAAAAAAALALLAGGVIATHGDAPANPSPSPTVTVSPSVSPSVTPSVSPSVTVPAPPKPVQSRVVRYVKGKPFMTGADVKRIAAFLGVPKTKVRKGWGPTADAYLRAWQKTEKLKVDGEWGRQACLKANWIWHP